MVTALSFSHFTYAVSILENKLIGSFRVTVNERIDTTLKSVLDLSNANLYQHSLISHARAENVKY